MGVVIIIGNRLEGHFVHLLTHAEGWTMGDIIIQLEDLFSLGGGDERNTYILYN